MDLEKELKDLEMEFTNLEIFPTQRSNPGLPHCRWLLYQLSHKGCPRVLEWVVYPFSTGPSWPRNWAKVSSIAGGFFTTCYELWGKPDLFTKDK